MKTRKVSVKSEKRVRTRNHRNPQSGSNIFLDLIDCLTAPEVRFIFVDLNYIILIEQGGTIPPSCPRPDHRFLHTFCPLIWSISPLLNFLPNPHPHPISLCSWRLGPFRLLLSSNLYVYVNVCPLLSSKTIKIEPKLFSVSNLSQHKDGH